MSSDLQNRLADKEGDITGWLELMDVFLEFLFQGEESSLHSALGCIATRLWRWKFWGVKFNLNSKVRLGNSDKTHLYYSVIQESPGGNSCQ